MSNPVRELAQRIADAAQAVADLQPSSEARALAGYLRALGAEVAQLQIPGLPKEGARCPRCACVLRVAIYGYCNNCGAFVAVEGDEVRAWDPLPMAPKLGWRWSAEAPAVLVLPPTQKPTTPEPSPGPLFDGEPCTG